MSKPVIPSHPPVPMEEIKKVEEPKRRPPVVGMVDPYTTDEVTDLKKSIENILDGGSKNSVERLAFEIDPTRANDYASLYYPKLSLIPDNLLKRISIQASVVAAIVQARSAHISAFGRPQTDRFTTGFRIEPKPGVLDDTEDEVKEALQDRIDEVSKLLLSCGKTIGWEDDDRLNLSQFLQQIVRDGIVVGRWAVEIIYATNAKTGKKEFHSFRPADAATIYRAKPQSTQAESIRKQAFALLESVKNKKLEPERFMNDEYSWIQVMDSKPMQAFTSKEMLVHNLYPVTDINLGGYPLTPIDTVISDVMTHINITTHNKLYFQNGRAARGMLVIQSADVDQTTITNIRQQFNASINSSANAWRMPVFGVMPEDNITWQPLEGGSNRDMEFQYLSDQNTRTILSAFQMSPEELPGAAHLSRGTANQSLSESNNEYKLLAARDVGIRPLLANVQDFFNDRILPLIDPKVAELCYLKFAGLDADTPEKETTRLQQDGTLHMTYNEILAKVEKDPLPPNMGGDFPLNPVIQGIIEKYTTFGEILETFFDKQGASEDPMNQFYQNPMWMNWYQMKMQEAMMQQQMEQQEQMMAQEQAAEQGGQPPPDQEAQAQEQEDPIASLLSKSENKNLDPSRKKLLSQHRGTVKHIMEQWKKESELTLKRIANEVSKYKV